MGKRRKKSATPRVYAFFIPSGPIYAHGKHTEVRFIGYKGDKKRLCRALSVTGVIDAYIVSDRVIGVVVLDTKVVCCYVPPTGGIFVTTTHNGLTNKLTSLPDMMCNATEPRKKALEALGLLPTPPELDLGAFAIVYRNGSTPMSAHSES